MSPLRRKSYIKLIEKPNTVLPGKKYEWIAKPEEEHYNLFRRPSELDKWQYAGQMVVVDGIVFTNFVGVSSHE